MLKSEIDFKTKTNYNLCDLISGKLFQTRNILNTRLLIVKITQRKRIMLKCEVDLRTTYKCDLCSELKTNKMDI